MNIKTHSYSIIRNTSPNREKPRYIVMHYTACDGSTAKNSIDYFGCNPAATNASADFFIDDNEIWQYNTQIDSRYCWAVGDGQGGTYGSRCTNRNSISIEMACWYDGMNTGKWQISDAVYNRAVELVKYLMQKYAIPAENVIRHYDVSLKWCPNAYGWLSTTGSEVIWKKFKAAISSDTAAASSKSAQASDKTVNTPIYRVRKSANDSAAQIGAYVVLHNAKAQADAHPGYKVFDMSGKLVYDPAAKTAKTVEQLAREVISGKWGSGADRRNRLTSAGYDYAAVQAEVNRMMG